jgi:hypothetical protein
MGLTRVYQAMLRLHSDLPYRLLDGRHAQRPTKT